MDPVYILIVVAFGGFSVRDLNVLTVLNVPDHLHVGPPPPPMGPSSSQPGAMSPCPRYTIAGPQPCCLDGPQPYAVLAYLLDGPLRHTL